MRFTRALKNVFANTCIYAAKNNAATSFWPSCERRVWSRRRRGEVLLCSRRKERPWNIDESQRWDCIARGLVGKETPRWSGQQPERQQIRRASRAVFRLCASGWKMAGKWCSPVFRVGERWLLPLRRLPGRMLRRRPSTERLDARRARGVAGRLLSPGTAASSSCWWGLNASLGPKGCFLPAVSKPFSWLCRPPPERRTLISVNGAEGEPAALSGAREEPACLVPALLCSGHRGHGRGVLGSPQHRSGEGVTPPV